MSYKSPCKDCANRSIGCHPNCKPYLDSVEKMFNDVEKFLMFIINCMPLKKKECKKLCGLEDSNK